MVHRVGANCPGGESPRQNVEAVQCLGGESSRGQNVQRVNWQSGKNIRESFCHCIQMFRLLLLNGGVSK